jgi:hypothetical protein
MERVLYISLTAMDSHAITFLLRVGGLGDMPPEKRVEMLSKNGSERRNGKGGEEKLCPEPTVAPT